jgi:hypothetical protein
MRWVKRADGTRSLTGLDALRIASDAGKALISDGTDFVPDEVEAGTGALYVHKAGDPQTVTSVITFDAELKIASGRQITCVGDLTFFTPASFVLEAGSSSLSADSSSCSLYTPGSIGFEADNDAEITASHIGLLAGLTVAVETNGTTAIQVDEAVLVNRPTAFDHAIRVKYTSVSANTTLGFSHHWVSVRTDLGAYTITLPSAASAGAGFEYIVKDGPGNAATNNITIATTSSQTIDGASSVVIDDDYGVRGFVSNGTNWEMA